jgi:hypothetical protein
VCLGADEWVGLKSVGIEIPEEEIQALHATLHSMPKRNNQDHHALPNTLGKRLLELCKVHGLVILNGRLTGDESGSFTFHADGRQGRSVIDYFITSPQLLFTEDGSSRNESYMHVWQNDACPCRPDGGNFDHVPLMLAIGLDAYSRPPETKKKHDRVQGQNATSFKWRDDVQPAYGDILRNDVQVNEHLSKVCDASSSAIDKEAAFVQAITLALHKLHGTAGRVEVCRKSGTDTNTAPNN